MRISLPFRVALLSTVCATLIDGGSASAIGDLRLDDEGFHGLVILTNGQAQLTLRVVGRVVEGELTSERRGWQISGTRAA